MTGLWLGLGTLALSAVFGLLWRRRQGRVQRSRPDPGAPALPDVVRRTLDNAADDTGDDTAVVTLLQISHVPLCARCPQARAVLSELAAVTPGVRYAELDLAEHPELAGQLGVRSTPTTLALARTGHELFRVTGVPVRAELLTALSPHL